MALVNFQPKMSRPKVQYAL